MDVYRPVIGGRPASSAYAIPWGTSSAVSTSPATRSLESQLRRYDESRRSPGATERSSSPIRTRPLLSREPSHCPDPAGRPGNRDSNLRRTGRRRVLGTVSVSIRSFRVGLRTTVSGGRPRPAAEGSADSCRGRWDGPAASGEELAELPQGQQCDGGHERPREMLPVEPRGSQQASEAVHLGDEHRQDELTEGGPVHLLAVERGRGQHRLGLASALERRHDQAQGKGGEGDRLTDLDAAE